MSIFLSDRLSKLTLGTAQLGMEYGIANKSGCPDEQEAAAVLDAAWQAGVTCLDTARAYGKAEERIGRWRKATGCHPLIVTKLPSLAGVEDGDLDRVIRSYVDVSCRALGVDRLDGYLVHRLSDLQRPMVTSILRRLVHEGKIGEFGASAYNVQEVESALNVDGVTIVQIPVNVFDHAMLESRTLARCQSSGVAVFARSIFWQGVMFLNPGELPLHLRPARMALERFHQLCDTAGWDAASLALAAVRDIPGITSIVIGVDNIAQLQMNVRAASLPRVDQGLLDELRALGKDLPRTVLDPSQWPAGSSQPVKV